MPEANADLFTFDRLVHEPARLAILTVLSACRNADLLFLQSATGLTQGNLSSHLTTLEEAGLVAITRTFRRKRPYTTVQATPDGRKRFAAHWQQLEAMRKRATPRGALSPVRTASD